MADRREQLRRLATHPALWLGLFVAAVFGAVASFAGCSGWDPSEPFERNAPDVDRALALMDAGQFESAEEALEQYLGTGPCSEEGLGLPDRVRVKSNASFDLGLVLFHLAEQFGRRFGEEEADAGPDQAELDAQRALQIDCAQIVVKAIANDDDVPIDLRARAFYLSGNLEFLRKEYEAAVRAYDDSLSLVPGLEPEAGGDLIGADAAWNRAIALRRLQEEEEEDAGADAEPEEPDAEPDEPDAEPEEPDAGDDAGEDGGDDGGGEDAGGDASPEEQDQEPDAGGPDGGDDGGAEEPPPPEPDEEPIEEDEEPPTSSSYIDRMLDELEDAPTYQEEEARKRRGNQRPVMEDK